MNVSTAQRFNMRMSLLLVAIFFSKSLFFSPTAFAQKVIHRTVINEGDARENQQNSAGELMIKNKQGHSISAIILDSDIDAEVNGMIATIKMQQRFKNDSDEWVNGRYVFPLPENGAVDGLTLQIGDRKIVGVINEKEAAKKTFEEAKKAGKEAGLLQQHRPNLFSMAVANIPPQGEVVAEITMIDRVRYDQQIFSLRLPTTLTPRFIPGAIKQQPVKLDIEETQNVAINTASGWGSNTDVVPDAADITPPQKHATSDEISNRFRFELTLNAGVALAKITSDTHEIAISEFIDHESSEKLSQITLAKGLEKMDRDLVLTWEPISTAAPTAALFKQTLNGEHYSMAMLLPPTANIPNTLPREITFIVDSSGSMSGVSMEQAKQSLYLALDQLTPQDRFNVIDFDSDYRPLFSEPQLASVSHLGLAKSIVNNLNAGGGTQIFEPLNYALESRSSAHGTGQYLKQIIFITDGSVGNEQHLFQLISNKLGDARLFTVGIGSAPNSHFMSKAAQFGRGSFTYVANVNETVAKMTSLFKKINHPIARDLSITYPQQDGSVNIEQYPQKIPDLYAGEPIIVLTKSSQALNQIEITGDLLGNSWQRLLGSNNESNLNLKNTDNIDALWARKKVAHLMDGLYTGTQAENYVKPQVIKLGIDHHLLTQYTSFVAVEEVIGRPEKMVAKNKNVPNLMPKGNTMVAPQTATPADLLTIIGFLFLLFGTLCRSEAGINLGLRFMANFRHNAVFKKV